MKIAIIGTVGIPANYGGFETLVENLVEKKQNPDIQYIVYCSSKRYPQKLKEYKGAILKYIPFDANDWQAPLYDAISLLMAYFSADVVLSLGGNNIIHPILRLFKKTKVINNFDGMDFTREKWNGLAKKTMMFTTRITAKYADICIADNEIIQQHLLSEYRRSSYLIEYGGDNALVMHDDKLLYDEFSLKPQEYCFMGARIEPENNIEMLLESFRQTPVHKLVIAGNWQKSEFGRIMKEKYKRYNNIVALDFIVDTTKLNLLRSNCKLYIHGHSVGGTNPSLVEAMSVGLPIAAYGKTPYNRGTTENKALYFDTLDDLKNILNRLDTINLKEIGAAMKEITDRRYTWDIICKKYEMLYKVDH
jgi:glycosyltransferase involved in cell wall biosynthesis